MSCARVQWGRWLWAGVLSCSVGYGGAVASAYQEAAVTHGATVSGTVILHGAPPAPVSFELRRYPDRVYCGALSDGSGYRLLREVAVGERQGVKDVVVTIEGVREGKPFLLRETKLEANMCQFVPFVSIVRDQHPMTVKNLDSVAHDLQFYERDRDHVMIMFHRPALTKSGTSDTVRMTGQRKSVTVQCGMHPYMQGHGLAVDNPYYAVTDLDGHFTITDLPPGTYRIKAWHPTLGERIQDITVSPDATVITDMSFEAK